MKITPIAGNTYVLEGHGFMGLYKLDAHRCILIDSGDITERQELLDTLDGAGLTPVGVMNTHIHIDHAINNATLRTRYGCAVAVAAGEVDTCRTLMGMKGYFYTYSPQMLQRYYGDMQCPVDAPIPYEDGMFEFCGVAFHMLHTPGHSPDHVCITTPDGVCFSGDTVFSNQALSMKLPYGLNLSHMMESTQRLRGLERTAFVVAHRGVHQSADPLIDATCELIQRRAQEVWNLVDGPLTLDQLWQRVIAYHTLPSQRLERAALMRRNMQGLVELLVDQGKLDYQARDGMLYLTPKEGL